MFYLNDLEAQHGMLSGAGLATRWVPFGHGALLELFLEILSVSNPVDPDIALVVGVVYTELRI